MKARLQSVQWRTEAELGTEAKRGGSDRFSKKYASTSMTVTEIHSVPSRESWVREAQLPGQEEERR